MVIDELNHDDAKHASGICRPTRYRPAGEKSNRDDEDDTYTGKEGSRSRAPINIRTPTMSPNTDMALSPCDTRSVKFILDSPAIRVPRGMGTMVYGSFDRKTAAT